MLLAHLDIAHLADTATPWANCVLTWRTGRQWRWRKPGHINLLEQR